jgi:hypothetical protein
MISLGQICNYLSDDPSSTTCFGEGEKYLNNKKLYNRTFGHTKWSEEGEVHIYSHVVQINDIPEPHTVKGVVILNEEGTDVSEIKNFTCTSCKAEPAHELGPRCQHVSAVLLLMNRCVYIIEHVNLIIKYYLNKYQLKSNVFFSNIQPK